MSVQPTRVEFLPTITEVNIKAMGLMHLVYQLHLHGSPMDIGHGSMYGNYQGFLVDRGVWGGEK